MEKNLLQQEVTIDEETHTYTDTQGREYLSVTRLLKKFVEDTDFKKIAGYVAKKRKRVIEKMAKEKGISVTAAKNLRPKYQRGTTKDQVLKEWDLKRIEASDAGSYIHHQLELAGTKNSHNRNCPYMPYYTWFLDNYGHYRHSYYEQIVYLENPRIAGTIDFLYFRTNKRGMVNIRDFKTNEYNMDSTLVDEYEGHTKHYNRYMLKPLDHLEDCDFTKYCLQQSIYMYILEEMMGVKPGNLGVIWMPWKNVITTPEVHQMPYMKFEAKEIIEEYAKTEKQTKFDESEMYDFVKI